MTRRDHEDKSLARSLGEFVGHIWSGIKTKPGSAERREVSRSVEEREAQTPGGKVTLRRTVIEEVEVEKPHDRG
ncbi:MAG: hypothetical protein KF684_11415 [Phycisphaeraceae bacterium]|nr:hypothetical protein [Phycisphaeraceae bacterium]